MPVIPTFTPDGEKIRKLRIERGLSPTELATEIRRHPQTIRRIEGGRQSRVGELLISQIATALDTKVDKITVAAA
jgi:transcriptional regulator with XRE-family HTH domain